MWTSNYANLSLIKPPMSPVSISRGKPRWKGGWRGHLPAGVVGKEDMRLAPSWAALKSDDDTYDRAFAAILRGLDPAAVYRELGEDAVLLCFCPPGQYCHRRLVAEWFEASLGVIVPELGVDRIDTPMCVTPHFDFYRPMDDKYEWLEEKLGLPIGSSE